MPVKEHQPEHRSVKRKRLLFNVFQYNIAQNMLFKTAKIPMLPRKPAGVF